MISGIRSRQVLSAQQKAEVDNTHRDLDYLGYYKTEFLNCFIVRCFEENDDNHTRRKEPELLLLVAQSTDYGSYLLTDN